MGDAIKLSKRQLTVPGGTMDAVLHELASVDIGVLPMEPPDLLFLATLPPVHKDPLDRMIVAQALRHGMTLVTVDSVLEGYGVPVLWT